MLSTFRFLLDASLPAPLRDTSGCGGVSVDFRSTEDAEVVSVTTATLSKALVSAMSGGGDVAFCINGDLSLTTGVLTVATSASSRRFSELTSLPR